MLDGSAPLKEHILFYFVYITKIMTCSIKVMAAFGVLECRVRDRCSDFRSLAETSESFCQGVLGHV